MIKKILVFSLLPLCVNSVYALQAPNQYSGDTPHVKVTTTISATVQQSLSSNSHSVTALQADESSKEASSGTTLSTPFSIESNGDEPYVVTAQSVDDKNQTTPAQLDYGNGVTSDYSVSYTPCNGSQQVDLSNHGQVLDNSQINADSCQQKSGQLTINVGSSSSQIAPGSTAEGNVAVVVQQQ